MNFVRNLISIPLFAAISFAAALAKADDERPPAPPLPETNIRVDYKTQELLIELHRKSSIVDFETFARKIYSDLGLNEEQVKDACAFDKRFTMYEVLKMTEAGIKPKDVNGYPEVFISACVYALRNHGISASEAHDMLYKEPYSIVPDEVYGLKEWDQFEAFALGVPLKYFQEGKALKKPFQQIISEYNENLLQKEFGVENIKRFKEQMHVKTFNQCRHKVWVEVIKNFLDPKRNANKPLALCSLGTNATDEFNALSKNPAQLLMNETNLFISQANENELAELIVKLGQQQGFDADGKPKGIPLWIDCGHGEQDSIQKDKNHSTEDDHKLSVSDYDFVQKTAPYLTTVILFACKTAQGYEETQTNPKKANSVYAVWLGNNLPRAKIYAAPQRITSLYTIDKNFKPYWDADVIAIK